jgi:superfamily II DNA or RNA helicase
LARAYEDHDAPILQLATAAGKTVIFAETIRRLAGLRVLVLVHRRELIAQASRKLADAGVPHGVIAAGFASDPSAAVQIASVQTLARRLDALPEFDLIVIDECHHARAASWRRLSVHPDAKLLGVTATPARLDGKGLGVKHGGLFDTIVCGPPSAELIEDGYLSKVRCFSPARKIDTAGLRTRLGDYEVSGLAAASDNAAVTGDAVEHYRKHADHRPAIAFCVTVDHAKHVAETFRKAGYRSKCIHGELPTAQRDRLISWFGSGYIEVLTSWEIISEGLDVPSVGAVILLRPTKSLTLHLQQIGRGMRPAPGKGALVVLDHAGNVIRHGLPEHDRVWTLNGVVQERQPGEAKVKVCPDCSAIVAVATQTCPHCGHVFWVARIETESGTLTEIKSEAALLRLSYHQIVKLRLSETQLRAYAKSRGYRSGGSGIDCGSRCPTLRREAARERREARCDRDRPIQ